MTTILVADDTSALVEGISLTLEAAGFHVLKAYDGVEALALLDQHAVDMILADIAMPRLNGYQLYQRVRENPRWLSVPFVFLSARALDSDIRFGRELGADDYLTKPIHAEDLLATVQGRLRRARQLAKVVASTPAPPRPAAARLPSLGRLRVDAGQHRAWMDGRPLSLSAREFVLLAYLAQRVESVVPPHELIYATHGLTTDDVDAGTLLRPLVRKLRRKLGYAVGETGCIENVRGVGYRLVAPE